MPHDDRRPCAKLRYKQMFYKDVDGPPSEREAAAAATYGSWDTTAYWCDCTQGGRGPDDQPVNRDVCSNPRRACFRAEKPGP